MEYKQHITNEYDKELSNINSLKWYPWIGKNYNKTKVLVIGESHYEDGDEWQEGNTETTRIITAKCFTGNKAKIYRNTEKVLLSIDNPTIEQGNYLWESVTYWNLVQRLMNSIEERPNDEDYDNGWATFFELVEILKPNICIVLGQASSGRLGYYLNNYETSWQRVVQEFYNEKKVINLTQNDYKLKLIFINHPSGSFGFNYETWSDLVKENSPNLSNLLTLK